MSRALAVLLAFLVGCTDPQPCHQCMGSGESRYGLGSWVCADQPLTPAQVYEIDQAFLRCDRCDGTGEEVGRG